MHSLIIVKSSEYTVYVMLLPLKSVDVMIFPIVQEEIVTVTVSGEQSVKFILGFFFFFTVTVNNKCTYIAYQ